MQLLRVMIVLAVALPARAAEPGRDAPPAGAAVNDHPVVAGFERFFRAADSDEARGGRLLLGELSCVACHAAGRSLERRIEAKQAPLLDTVGARVQPAYVRRFLADPHGTKPGTTMPDVLAALPAAERTEAIEALTHLLASTGHLSASNPVPSSIGRGRTLYQRVGCLACHDPVESRQAPGATSVPLVDLAGKYTIPSLAGFLLDPLRVRPSGRMPALNLTKDEAGDLASYLLRDLRGKAAPTLTYRYYEGSWARLPDFSALSPRTTGQTSGLDITVARRANQFAIEFEGSLKIEREGKYAFHLRSDDGSQLRIDGKMVVDNDGIHPPQEKSGSVELTAGQHGFVAALFDGGGEVELEVEYEGPGIQRQPVGPALSLTSDAPTAPGAEVEARFVVDGALVEKGREVFARVGCASCHQLRQDGQAIRSRLTAPSLGSLRAAGGCLGARRADDAAPRYHLDERQRQALAAAIGGVAGLPTTEPAPREVVAGTMTAFHCYACHQRDGIGGVEESRNAFFQTMQKEMGDEGRLPPPLDGVGSKLTAEYLRRLFDQGVKDRPYMLTRMPRFGQTNVGHLIPTLDALDSLAAVGPVEFHEPMRKVKSDGRFLVGGEALGCIKCHTFKGIQAEGVQAIDMTVMTARLRRDWFHRYLVDPQAFRPGTRMPGGWPMGKSLLPQVLGGDTRAQIEAVWMFLSEGRNASEPYGLGRNPIPLVAAGEPVIYRNFIRGAGPRAIGVGYPEKVNLAFDANTMRIALIWQGAFIDASRHWTGRGEGFQGPLGDNVLSLASGPSLATLATGSAPWPDQPPRETGYAFRGYRLDAKGRPTFLYDFGLVHVADTPEPVASKPSAGLCRTLTLTATAPRPDLWFRAAVADTIERLDGSWYGIDGEWKLRIESADEPVIRKSGGKTELLVPVVFPAHEARIVEEFAW